MVVQSRCILKKVWDDGVHDTPRHDLGSKRMKSEYQIAICKVAAWLMISFAALTPFWNLEETRTAS